MREIDLELLVDIAKEAESGDPIPWDKLSVGKDEAFKMIGTSILEQFDKEAYTEEDKVVLLASMTKLVVENMLLHIQVLNLKKQLEDLTDSEKDC